MKTKEVSIRFVDKFNYESFCSVKFREFTKNEIDIVIPAIEEIGSRKPINPTQARAISRHSRKILSWLKKNKYET